MCLPHSLGLVPAQRTVPTLVEGAASLVSKLEQIEPG